jgi:hypothetical protein
MITTEQETRSDEIRCYFQENLRQILPGGSQINICCPLHEEQSPSFSMDLNKGLWTCHAKCGSGNFAQLRARIDAEIAKH